MMLRRRAIVLLRIGVTVWLCVSCIGFYVFFTKLTTKPADTEQLNAEAWRWSDGERETGAAFPRLQMTMLTDDPKTVVENPWHRINELRTKCSELGASYFRTAAGRPLPTASVVITFHSGESLYNLLHTVHSVVQRSPPDLLHEVILVNDFAQKDDFEEPLSNYIQAAFGGGGKVRVLHNDRNVGLIQSRLKGIRAASGDVFVVMDSHSEVQPLWLEPLLYEIASNRRTLANSFIDWMSKKDGVWTYRYCGTAWTVFFDWTLVFGWQTLSYIDIAKRKLTDAIKTKAIIGAYNAMDRKFFEEIGALDEDMKFWGGENIDLAIRTWLFGGRVVSVPCSRVAHLEAAGSRDYRKHHDADIQRNYKRVVEVWFDDFKRYYYLYNPPAVAIDAGNLTSRFQVKRRAQHNFSWFLDNVYPELAVPDRNSFAWGQIVNVGSKLCLDVNTDMKVYRCSKSNETARNQLMWCIIQLFIWSDEFELRRDVQVVNTRRLLKEKHTISLDDSISFYSTNLSTRWIHWTNGPLMDARSKLCLEGGPVNTPVQLKPCEYQQRTIQRWTFTHYTPLYDRLLVGNAERWRPLNYKLLALRRRHVADTHTAALAANRTVRQPPSVAPQ